jgi:hypothetical protein
VQSSATRATCACSMHRYGGCIRALPAVPNMDGSHAPIGIGTAGAALWDMLRSLWGGGMNAKRKGTRNEHRSIALLEAAGYRCTRAAASLGEWDIIGVSAADVVLVQVKTNAWPGSAETETLRLFPCPQNARKLLHRWRDRQQLPDVKELP